MSDLIRPPIDPKAKAGADAALVQIYGDHAYGWAPVALADLPGVKRAA